MPDERNRTGPRPRVQSDDDRARRALAEAEKRQFDAMVPVDFADIDDAGEDPTPPPHDLPDALRDYLVERQVKARDAIKASGAVLQKSEQHEHRIAALERAKSTLVKVVVSLAVTAATSLGAAYSAARSAAERDGRNDATIEAMQRDLAAANHRVETIESILLRSPRLLGLPNP